MGDGGYPSPTLSAFLPFMSILGHSAPSVVCICSSAPFRQEVTGESPGAGGRGDKQGVEFGIPPSVQSLNGSIHCILARAEVGRVLHARIAEAGVLLGLQSETGQAGVACVPVDVGWRWGCIGASWGRIERGSTQVVEGVTERRVEARGGHHARGDAHGGDGGGWREDGLRAEWTYVDRVEKWKAFSRQRRWRQAFGCPIVVGWVAGVHVLIRLH